MEIVDPKTKKVIAKEGDHYTKRLHKLIEAAGITEIPVLKELILGRVLADDLVDAEKAYSDQVRYLTMQNGLYDLFEHKLVEHTPSIFTTNLLPYDYDPEAQCPRWLQYLDEVFMSDADTIKFFTGFNPF